MAPMAGSLPPRSRRTPRSEAQSSCEAAAAVDSARSQAEAESAAADAARSKADEEAAEAAEEAVAAEAAARAEARESRRIQLALAKDLEADSKLRKLANHGEPKTTWTCQLCRRSFNTQKILSQHMSIHYNERLWVKKSRKAKSEHLDTSRSTGSDRDSGSTSRRNMYTSPRHMRPWRVEGHPLVPRSPEQPRSHRSNAGSSASTHRSPSAPSSRYIGLRREVQEMHGAREPRPWVRRTGPFQPAMALPASEGADNLMMWCAALRAFTQLGTAAPDVTDVTLLGGGCARDASPHASHPAYAGKAGSIVFVAKSINGGELCLRGRRPRWRLRTWTWRRSRRMSLGSKEN